MWQQYLIEWEWYLVKLILKQGQGFLPLSFHFRKVHGITESHWWLRREVSLQRKMLNSI